MDKVNGIIKLMYTEEKTSAFEGVIRNYAIVEIEDAEYTVLLGVSPLQTDYKVGDSIVCYACNGEYFINKILASRSDSKYRQFTNIIILLCLILVMLGLFICIKPWTI